MIQAQNIQIEFQNSHRTMHSFSFPPHTIDQDFSPSQSYEELTAMNEPWLKEKEERESSRL